jgi:ferredoxin--NADP+ reductase
VLRLLPDAAIDILERLPVPFGLIRYGVAPDHQNTKAVSRVFERVLARDRVNFFGNVEVGRDVLLHELLDLYDVVVLATGAERDRLLGIPGEGLPGVVGSGVFVGWYNSHPDRQPPAAGEVRSAVVIGNGNVAIDVARILAKNPDELAGSDLSPQVMEWLTAQPLETIHIVGRRNAADAKFTDHELAELGTLQRARPVVIDPGASAVDTATAKTLRGFGESPPRETPVTINFHFGLTPVAFLGDKRLNAVQFRSAAGTITELPAQVAVTCIGYEAVPCCTAQPTNGVFANHDGKIDERLYVVGWAKRGPSGTIPTNRAEAQLVAQKIAQEITSLDRPGVEGLRQLLSVRQACWVDHAGWRRIDAAELASAGARRCRSKYRDINEMLDVAQSGQLRPA